MAAGHHNGFNPFRDAHGRWATPGGANAAASASGQPAGKGGGAMNDSLRSASGRATGGGGGGGDGGGKPPVSAKGANPTIITPKQLAAVDALPNATFSSVSPATRAELQTHLGSAAFPPAEALSYALSEISIKRQTGQLDDTATKTLMTKALTEAGYVAPANVTMHDVLRLMDHVTETRDYDLRDKRSLYGAAVAVKLGDLDVAHNFLDGPDGAGIGWTLTMQEIQKNLGIPVTDGYADGGF